MPARRRNFVGGPTTRDGTVVSPAPGSHGTLVLVNLATLRGIGSRLTSCLLARTTTPDLKEGPQGLGRSWKSPKEFALGMSR